MPNDGPRIVTCQSLAERQAHVEDLEATLAMRTGQLASARQELDAVRTARDNLDRQLGEARKHYAECRRAS